MELQKSGKPTTESWLKIPEAIDLADYVYDLPEARVARYPLPQRDASQLMINKNGKISHQHFFDLPANLDPKTLLVFNDTKVIPARAYFKKDTGASIEVLLLHPETPTRIINDAMLVKQQCVWECMIGNKKRWKLKDVLSTNITINDQSVTLKATYADYERNHIQLHWSGEFTFLEVVKALGEIPLPPYLNRDTEEQDRQNYQTVYAHYDGAVAAPTAGLHFTENVFKELEAKGVEKAFLTLHVGAGTFLPIKVDSVTEHKMHAEQIVFSRSLIDQLLVSSEMIVSVGTTSMRSLESLYWFGVKLFRKETTEFWIENLYPYPLLETELPTAKQSLEAIGRYMDEAGLDHLTGETEIFIFPGYRFQLCKGLITNYHQPGSTLILLVAAFVGLDWKKIYSEAINRDYRFLSYGDSSLLWLNTGG